MSGRHVPLALEHRGDDADGIGPIQPCGMQDCVACDTIAQTARRPGEDRAAYVARLKAQLRGPAQSDALARPLGPPLAICPVCTRLYLRGTPCSTCNDPLVTVTGVV